MGTVLTPTLVVPIPAGPLWSWLPAAIDGADIVARHVTGSRYGGVDDKEDSGEGASGFSTHAHPDYLGVALPQRGRRIRSMADCPIPRLPWFIPVKVFSEHTGKTAWAHLIDLGPSLYIVVNGERRYLKRGIDMTNAVIDALGLDRATGEYPGISYRIVGGAKNVDWGKSG